MIVFEKAIFGDAGKYLPIEMLREVGKLAQRTSKISQHPLTISIAIYFENFPFFTIPLPS